MLGLLWFAFVVMLVWFAGKTADTTQRKQNEHD